MTNLNMAAPVEGLKQFPGKLRARRDSAVGATAEIGAKMEQVLKGLQALAPFANAAGNSIVVVQNATVPATKSSGPARTPSVALATEGSKQRASAKKPRTFGMGK